MSREYLEREEVSPKKSNREYLERDSEGNLPERKPTTAKEYSIFNADDRAKALEGAKIAFMGDELGNLDIENIPGNVISGVGNGLAGAVVGATEFAGDTINFFTPDFLGGDTAEAWFDESANRRRKDIDKNSAVGAMAEELAYGAGVGGVAAKGIDLAIGAAKGVGRVAKSGVLDRGKTYVDDLTEEFKAAEKRVNIRKKRADKKRKAREVDDTLANADKDVIGMPYVSSYDKLDAKRALEAANKEATKETTQLHKVERKAVDTLDALKKGTANMTPHAQIAMEVAGRVSPKFTQTLGNYWDNVAAYGLGNKSAAARKYLKEFDDLLHVKGYAEQTVKGKINNIINRKGSNNSVTGALVESIFKPVSRQRLEGYGIATSPLQDTTTNRVDGRPIHNKDGSIIFSDGSMIDADGNIISGGE